MAVSKRSLTKSISTAEATSWYCVLIILVALILLNSFRENSMTDDFLRGNQLMRMPQPCEEIYVVGEGETLHTISDRCGDPFIVEQNPHIHDPDDVFPGLVIKITPSRSRKLLK